MFRLSRFLSILALLIISVFCFYTQAHSWTGFAETSELFAVGTANGTEWSYLYKINPVTGELTLLGDTGHNNCTGLDFTPEGKLKATCEVRGGLEFRTNELEAGDAVALEVDDDDAFPEWAVPHGITNFISDITIADDGVLYTFENLKQVMFHMHLEEEDFMAELIGAPAIEAADHGLASWGAAELKVAANTGTPSLYSVDTETADVKLIGALSFPDGFGLATAQEISTRVKLEEIEFASMDAIKLDGAFGGVVTSTSAVAAGYGFAEADADFAVLLTTTNERVILDADSRVPGSEEWAGIALLDLETMSVDYIVDVDQAPVEVDAIAVRRLPTREVPTLSTAGILVTGAILLLIGLVFYRRKYGLSS